MSVPARNRSATVDADAHVSQPRGAVPASATQQTTRHERLENSKEDDNPLRFEPPAVWVVSNRREPWVQIVAICRDRSAARRLADQHNAGRDPDDEDRWHVEPHPCNVVAHVL